MDESPEPAGQEAARAGVSRQRILELLRAAPDGLGVQELAERTGLHGNTVRFHLDRLVGDGMAQRRVEERGEPGRPRLTFTAAPRPDPARDSRNYQFLSEILASYLSGTAGEPAAVAVEVGRTWGRYLTERPAPYQRVSEEEAVQRLLRILDDIGFAPELAADDPRQIRIPHCPFREVAEAHREVVCSVHLGLMRGALAEMDAPVTADRLIPFVTPSLCVAHLAPVADGEPDAAH
ncbi:ArsR family transcriptional regulator [Geodermatophilus sp. TF02-6]|uniref:helix-turn-helix transcriptional regulator n=1 Tax=Geodermatophilus sp. TF02-6 TaxID=2250575 RepID=UPI000DEA172E|nr:helix-turn-helix domain-containing protein [Geodermatophilus sp. TF02-6]RBY81677.1 ArsR family transcriptional regulator [Geodermatophilus sp. TF02-6]